MGRFITTITGTKTNTKSLTHRSFVKAGLVTSARVLSYARNLLARLAGQPAPVAVAVCRDRMAAKRLGRELEQESLALIRARLGWRPVRQGSCGSPGGF